MSTKNPVQLINGCITAYGGSSGAVIQNIGNWPISAYSLDITPFSRVRVTGTIRHNKYRYDYGGSFLFHLFPLGVSIEYGNSVFYRGVGVTMIDSNTIIPFDTTLDVSAINQPVFIVFGAEGASSIYSISASAYIESVEFLN